jgi:hypothetical protein
MSGLSNPVDAAPWLAGVLLVAALAPTIIAMIRGARENHLGGILVLNVMVTAASFFSSLLGLAAIALLPITSSGYLLVLAWAFIAPCRVADREAAARHRELMAALQGKPLPAPAPPPAPAPAWPELKLSPAELQERMR